MQNIHLTFNKQRVKTNKKRRRDGNTRERKKQIKNGEETEIPEREIT
jgi:hypothetical protein